MLRKIVFLCCLLVTICAAAIFLGASGHCFAGIVYPSPPPGGSDLAYGELSGILKHDPGFLGHPIGELKLGSAHRVFTADLKEVAAGRLLAAARSDNLWRYFVMHGADAVGDVQLCPDNKAGGALRFNGAGKFNSGDITAALQAAAALPQVKKQDYEIRTLEIAPILFAGLWLHPQTDDIILPLPNTFGRMSAFHPYTGPEMAGLLRKIAAEKLLEISKSKGRPLYD